MSVTIRTASRSTVGTLRPSGFASAVRAAPVSAAIMAVTKPANPRNPEDPAYHFAQTDAFVQQANGTRPYHPRESFAFPF